MIDQSLSGSNLFIEFPGFYIKLLIELSALIYALFLLEAFKSFILFFTYKLI